MEAAILSLVQFRRGGARGVAGLDDNGRARLVADTSTTLELARRAIAEHVGLAELADRLANEELDLSVLTLLAAVAHPDPAHLTVSGTGLTHLGSAEGRDR